MNKGTTVEEIVTAAKPPEVRGHPRGILHSARLHGGAARRHSVDARASRNPRNPTKSGSACRIPLPGTKFYELVKAQLGDKTHWRESNDLEMMFEGTYTSDFYRAVRNLLHDQVSLQTAIRTVKATSASARDPLWSSGGANCWRASLNIDRRNAMQRRPPGDPSGGGSEPRDRTSRRQPWAGLLAQIAPVQRLRRA